MSSVAFNLSRKLEWMSRKLRKLDDAGKIRDWVTTMAAINSLLKVVDGTAYSNDWQPWRKKENTQKKILKDNETQLTSLENSVPGTKKMDVEESQGKGTKRLRMQRMPELKPAISTISGTSQKLNKDHRYTPSAKREIKEVDVKKEKVNVKRWAQFSGIFKAANGIGIKTEATNNEEQMEVDKGELVNRENEAKVGTTDLTNKQVRQLWKEELHRRLKKDGRNCGVEWSDGITREWNTGNTLLKSIAQVIDRDVVEDLDRKDCNLKSYLDNESNFFLKSGKYAPKWFSTS